MTTLDPARSRRGDKRQLFATLDMAIIQSGVEGFDADTAYSLSTWSMNQGRRLPWYYRHEKHILHEEGGKDSVVLHIAGMALALVPNYPDDPKEAFFQAGVEWRKGIRRQYGDGSARAEWHVPHTFSDLGDRDPTSVSRPSTDVFETWLTEHSLELRPSNQEDFDLDKVNDPRIRQLWENASDAGREVMVLIGNGVADRDAAEIVGVAGTGYRQRKTKLRKLAQGAAA